MIAANISKLVDDIEKLPNIVHFHNSISIHEIYNTK